MKRRVRAKGVRRSEVDEDQLAIAFLLLSKILYERDQAGGETPVPRQSAGTDESDQTEAA